MSPRLSSETRAAWFPHSFPLFLSEGPQREPPLEGQSKDHSQSHLVSKKCWAAPKHRPLLKGLRELYEEQGALSYVSLADNTGRSL